MEQTTFTTQWTQENGHGSAKDALTPEKYDAVENASEKMVLRVRRP